eukprot:CAMPEP_0171086944 /NCGR_PEP_ID=MMETSP0766_2-20121228/19852_1 /TAXON_ID=439317 /ORGANISM="Gambierdiscus australes, Strain CAWD 149" /LENGTH=123 /DNA_ID=CAMNT_0011544617 /DNA_START=136 /DNA_END=507 /DNA_ORIENTATION=+
MAGILQQPSVRAEPVGRGSEIGAGKMHEALRASSPKASGCGSHRGQTKVKEEEGGGGQSPGQGRGHLQEEQKGQQKQQQHQQQQLQQQQHHQQQRPPETEATGKALGEEASSGPSEKAVSSEG